MEIGMIRRVESAHAASGDRHCCDRASARLPGAASQRRRGSSSSTPSRPTCAAGITSPRRTSTRTRETDLLAVATGAKVDLVWFENPTWTRHVMASGFPGMINADAFDIDKDGYPEVVAAERLQHHAGQGRRRDDAADEGRGRERAVDGEGIRSHAVGASRALDRCRRQRPQDDRQRAARRRARVRRPTTRTRSAIYAYNPADLKRQTDHRRG